MSSVLDSVLSPDFLFSQHSLNDYLECPRRFYLQYIAKQVWPLLETGYDGMDVLQYREYLRQGVRLHRWIERHWLGISPTLSLAEAKMADSASDIELQTWWGRFLDSDFSALPAQRLPELELAAQIDDYRLYARYDLLAIEKDRAVVVDWKTIRFNRPLPHHFWRDRLQTRVYLYVLASAGAPFNGGQPIPPENCSMRYWLANQPSDDNDENAASASAWIDINYSQAEFEADERRLRTLVQHIALCKHENEFEKTANEHRCTFCTFRTLCHRQGLPDSEWPDEDKLSHLLTEDVPELEY